MADQPEIKRHGPLQNYFVFPIARIISRTIMTICGRATAKGAYRVPRKGGILILPNHRADVDPLLVQMSCPRNIHFMGKAELFEIKWLAFCMRIGNAFPIKRGVPDRAALRRATELLKLGEAVCIFPEGQLTETGELQEIKPGVALIIRMAGTPVICLGLRNTDCVMPYGKLLPQITTHKVSSMWGEPRTFDKDASQEEILAWIEGQLRELTED